MHGYTRSIHHPIYFVEHHWIPSSEYLWGVFFFTTKTNPMRQTRWKKTPAAKVLTHNFMASISPISPRSHNQCRGTRGCGNQIPKHALELWPLISEGSSGQELLVSCKAWRWCVLKLKTIVSRCSITDANNIYYNIDIYRRTQSATTPWQDLRKLFFCFLGSPRLQQDLTNAILRESSAVLGGTRCQGRQGIFRLHLRLLSSFVCPHPTWPMGK